jgi:hypothetical protein
MTPEERAREAQEGRVWQVDGKTGEAKLMHCENCRVVEEAIAEEREACGEIIGRADSELRSVLGVKREGATSLSHELLMWANEIRAEEREACAKVVMSKTLAVDGVIHDPSGSCGCAACWTQRNLAAIIRART